MDFEKFRSLLRYKWDITKFDRVPHGYWNERSNQRQFMLSLANTLHISDFESWYKVRIQTVQQHGGSGLLRIYNYSLYKLVMSVFPEYLMRKFCIRSPRKRLMWFP